MRCVYMAKRIHTHRCNLCGGPIRRTDDQIRILRIGVTAHAHWSCWITQLRQSDQPTAEVVMGAV
jgi:hypothetical protein